MFEIVVEREFSAAHFLKLYDGSWEKRHGHQWKVAVTVRSEALDSMGVVVDFEALKPSLEGVLGEFNEKSINELPDFKDGRLNPSTENLAKIICERLQAKFKPKNARIVKVTVWETPDAQASFYPSAESGKTDGGE